MYKENKIHRNLVFVLLFALLILGCFIWYGEARTNREAPKRAKYVSNLLSRGDKYR